MTKKYSRIIAAIMLVIAIVFIFIANLKSVSSQDVTAGNINATANIDIVYE